MPGPSSVTSMRTWRPSRRAATSTMPPGSECLTALSTSATMLRWRPAGGTSTRSPSSWGPLTTWTSRRRARTVIAVTADSSTGTTAVGSDSGEVGISTDSKRSATTAFSARESARISSTTRTWGSVSATDRWSIWILASRIAKGVRSSCDASATNCRCRRSASTSGRTTRRVTSQPRRPAEAMAHAPMATAPSRMSTASTSTSVVRGVGCSRSPTRTCASTTENAATSTATTRTDTAPVIVSATRHAADRTSTPSASRGRIRRVISAPTGIRGRARSARSRGRSSGAGSARRCPRLRACHPAKRPRGECPRARTCAAG